MSVTEHILLESDERKLPQRRTARKLHGLYRFESRLRRRAIELGIIDYYYLSCQVRQGRSFAPEYVLDLRFIDPTLRQSRHIAVWWIGTTLAFATLAAALIWWTSSSPAQQWESGRLLACALLLGVAVCAGLVGVYRSTETLSLHTVHGQAMLLNVTGGIGTLRSARPFMLKLAAHVRIAAGARRSSKAAHLRDEMREHFRLKEAGVLSNEEYEKSKRRILAGHLPAV